MNTRERFLNSMLGGPVDRMFRYELGAWPSTVQKWKTEGLPDYVSDKEESSEWQDNVGKHKEKEAEMHKITVSFQDYFRLDKLMKLPINSGYTDSPFFPKFDQVILEEDGDRQIIIDYDGVKKMMFINNPDSSMPMFLEFPVKGPKEWDIIKRERLDPSNVRGLLGDIARLAVQINESERDFPVYLTACGGFGHPRNLMGDENLCLAYYDYPDMIHDIMRNWCDVCKEIISVVSEHIAIDEYMIWEDMSYKNGPLIGPDMFKEFISPYYIELISYAKSKNIASVSVDTDGDCRKLIPLFLEAGVDAIFPFEVQAGMDIVEIRKEYGDVFTIIGGIDKRALAQNKEAIKREVDRVIPFFMESLRYIPGLDHTVPPNVPLDNFLYYLECLRSYE